MSSWENELCGEISRKGQQILPSLNIGMSHFVKDDNLS